MDFDTRPHAGGWSRTHHAPGRVRFQSEEVSHDQARDAGVVKNHATARVIFKLEYLETGVSV